MFDRNDAALADAVLDVTAMDDDALLALIERIAAVLRERHDPGLRIEIVIE